MINTCKRCSAEFAVNRATRKRVLCDDCASPRVHIIDGQPMTMLQIAEACPDIGYGTLVSRIKWGWDTLEKLRRPVLPGRDSPWRRFRSGWLSKRGAA